MYRLGRGRQYHKHPTHLHGIGHSWSKDSWIIISKLNIHRAVHQLKGVAVGNLSTTPTLLHLGNQFDGGSDTEWVIAIANRIAVGVGGNTDSVTSIHLHVNVKIHDILLARTSMMMWLLQEYS